MVSSERIHIDLQFSYSMLVVLQSFLQSYSLIFSLLTLFLNSVSLASQFLHRVSHFQSIKDIQWCWSFFFFNISIFQFFIRQGIFLRTSSLQARNDQMLIFTLFSCFLMFLVVARLLFWQIQRFQRYRYSGNDPQEIKI